MTGLVILARLIGVLQPLEWKVLDLSLRWRPTEAVDKRITIVEITEEDIQSGLGYPISDGAVAQLIQTLQAYEPRAIGIDIFRDIPVKEGQQILASAFRESENVIGINRIDGPGLAIAPHPALPEERIGFADALLDKDGAIRRSLLASADPNGHYRFSLTIRMVEKYLAQDGLTLDNGLKDPETMRFGETEIPRLRANTGSYVRTNYGGNQALINFRVGQRPFTKVSYTQVLSGQVDPALIKDRAVLVGYTAQSVKDFVTSSAIISPSPSLIPGVDVQAHAISQILSAVYDGRPFLKALPEALEYLLIISSGLVGIFLASRQQKPVKHLLIVTTLGGLWLLLCYGLTIASWWLPLWPMLVAFGLNAIMLYPLYQVQRLLQAQVEERKKLVDWTYNTIHNGPLQISAGMLKDWPVGEPLCAANRSELAALNQELRDIHDVMRQEMLKDLVVIGHRSVDLQVPLDTLLYESYQGTLEKHRSFFESVIKIVKFEPMVEDSLTLAQKRELARFLEEALLNLYKHAKTATRLRIDCRCEGDFNIIRVVDNGTVLPQKDADHASQPSQEKSLRASKAYGTQQAKRLARQLNGHFERTHIQPHGTSCELRWPAATTGSSIFNLFTAVKSLKQAFAQKRNVL